MRSQFQCFCMKCLILLRLVLTLLTLTLAVTANASAFASEEVVQVSSGLPKELEALLSEKPVYHYSLFTNPATLLNAFPLLGGRGLHLGGEFISSSKIAALFSVGYTTHDLKSLNTMLERQQSVDDEDEDSADEERKITFHKSETMVANLGARYFFRPSSDGWFLGSLIRYQKDYAKVDYNETPGYVTRIVAGPQGHGGHRWIWRHGGFIDFFTGAFVVAYEQQKFNWETDDQERKVQAEKKYEKNALPSFMRYVVPEINISMGYLFQ